MATVRGDPYAAAGKPLFQVWDDLAARGKDEADQILFRQAHPRERAAADGVIRLAIVLVLRNVLPQRHVLLKSSW